MGIVVEWPEQLRSGRSGCKDLRRIREERRPGFRIGVSRTRVKLGKIRECFGFYCIN